MRPLPEGISSKLMLFFWLDVPQLERQHRRHHAPLLSEYLHLNIATQPCPRTIGTSLTCDLHPVRVLDCQSVGKKAHPVGGFPLVPELWKSGLRKRPVFVALSTFPRASEQMR
eukprot:3848900-Amphidinium_carterae.1